MATVNFILQSSKSNAPIYVRFKDARQIDVKRKTREMIDPEYWNAKTGKPKNIQSANKTTLRNIDEVKNTLPKIESFIMDQYRKRNDDEIINGEWLDEVINAYYNGGRLFNELEYIDNYLEHYRTQILPFRKYKGQPITDRTKKKHLTIIGKFEEFLKNEKKRLKVSDYNVATGNRFVTFLRSQNLNDNTVGKYLKYTKTIFSDAKIDNIAVHDQLTQIKGFTTDTPTHFVTPEEIAKIQNLKIVNDKMEMARDWFVIGCYTGQRAGDLFGMTSKKIVTINGNDYISVLQQKTKTHVQIPISKEVHEVLNRRNGEFPPVFSTNVESSKTMFNEQLKKICKLAEINRMEYGRKYDEVKKHFVFGEYPFNELVSSHVCRRTFATMHYGKLPTPIIMAVTGHKTEREFLGYIGADNTTLSEQMYQYWERMESKAKTPVIDPKNKVAN